jgi:hypothetical protein
MTLDFVTEQMAYTYAGRKKCAWGQVWLWLIG